MCLMAFSCTEQNDFEDTQPLQEVPISIKSETVGPVLSDVGPATSSYVTMEFNPFVNRDFVYNQVSQQIRVFSRTQCPTQANLEVWEVPLMSIEEFNIIFSAYILQPPTAGDGHSRDPYASPPPPPLTTYAYYGDFCQD